MNFKMIAAGLRMIADGLEGSALSPADQKVAAAIMSVGGEPEEPEAEAPAEDKDTTLAEVQQIAAKAIKADKQKFMDILDKLEAKNVSTIPADRRGEAFKAFEALLNGK